MTSYQPWYQFCTYPQWDIPLNTDAGADNITGLNINLFTMTFRDTTGVDTPGTGTFSVKVLNPAEVYYQQSAADVAKPFQGSLFVKGQSTDGREIVWDPILGPNGGPFVISPS